MGRGSSRRPRCPSLGSRPILDRKPLEPSTPPWLDRAARAESTLKPDRAGPGRVESSRVESSRVEPSPGQQLLRALQLCTEQSIFSVQCLSASDLFAPGRHPVQGVDWRGDAFSGGACDR